MLTNTFLIAQLGFVFQTNIVSWFDSAVGKHAPGNLEHCRTAPRDPHLGRGVRDPAVLVRVVLVQLLAQLLVVVSPHHGRQSVKQLHLGTAQGPGQIRDPGPGPFVGIEHLCRLDGRVLGTPAVATPGHENSDSSCEFSQERYTQ